MTTTIPKDDIVVAPARPASMRLSSRHLIVAGLVVAAFIAPLFASSFVTFQLTEVLIYGLAILGLNLLTGFNGQFSLGHSAFYGIGAYTAAILIHNYEVSYLWTLPAAGGVCFVIGFLFGLPALRLQNLYLALATFALATAMPQILKFHALEGWTGGVQGLVVDQPEAPEFSADKRRPVALLHHVDRRTGDVLVRREPHPQPHRPGDHGDPRQPDRRGGDGDQQFALQDADLRGKRAVHRRCRRAGGARHCLCRTG